MLMLGGSSLSARLIKGEVRDSLSGDPIGYANIYFRESRGGVFTDLEGKFSFNSDNDTEAMEISVMGYESRRIKADKDYHIILLTPVSRQLGEVIVRPGHSKYSKKNNPAVDLMERVRQTAYLHDPRNTLFYHIGKQEKIALGLNDFHFEKESDKVKKKFGFLREYSDTSVITGRPYLALSVKQRLAEDLYSSSHPHREITIARRSNGIDDAFEQENITTLLYDIFREVDIYGNDITLLQNRFVSPLSRIASNYYKYYITDTISISGRPCIELSFVPHNPESMGFNGRMYVESNDSMAYVKKIVMRVPSAVNLNYVNNLYLVQDFTLDEDGYFHKVNDIMGAELQLIPGTQIFYAERVTDYKNPDLTPRPEWTDWFTYGNENIVLPEADMRDETFWNEQLAPEVASNAAVRPPLLERLREIPVFYWAEKILSILVSGYIKTGKESKFDIGPVNTLISVNSVEGARFRLGGMSTALLSKRLFLRGYIAYGCKDKKFKYRVEADYSLIDKKYHSREYPINGFRLMHEYDYDLIGQHYLFTNPDNVFLSLKRAPSDKVTLRRQSKFSYIYENVNGFSLEASLKHEIQKPTRWLPFTFYGSEAPLMNYSVSSVALKLRFAPGEKFYQSKSDRLPVNMDAPIVQLTHEFGPKGLLGSSFCINRTELSLQKRFWFSAFGFTDIILKGGIIWSKVYYPALMWANANLSYTIQPESFSLMNPMEFATDHYLFADITYWGNGVLFNRIPLLKKARLREVLTFKGLAGGLNKRNNPVYNQELLRFPSDAGVSMLGKMPYMEVSAGIDNILTVLRVDYVWRLSYRDAPDISKGGVRVSLHFSF